MKKLVELVRVVNKNKIKSIEIIGSNTDNDTKLMQLYNGIQGGKINSDDDAVAYLYPDSDDRNAYYKLKHVLKDRLHNTLFFIDTKESKFTDLKRAYLECQRLLSLFNILNVKGAKQNALSCGEKALKIALKYEFTHEVITISRSLTNYYAPLVGDRKKLEYLHQLIEEHIELYLKETIAENHYQKILSLYANDRSTKEEVFEISSNYIRDLEDYSTPKESSNLVYFTAMLLIAKYMSVNDYQRALEVCTKSIAKIRSHHFLNTRAYFALSGNHLICCIQLKKYQEGEQLVADLMQMVELSTINWFKINELYFTLSLHTQNYQQAYECYQKVRAQKKFRSLIPSVKETWIIYGAWTHLLLITGRAQPPAGERPPTFRIQKFVNEVPTFSKDKQGLNIPILISQIFLLLQQKKYDTILDRMEAIAQYKYRYLNYEQNFRSNIFIRMLLEVPKGNFRRVQVIKRTEKLRPRLDEVPLEIASQSHDLEIIPYEDAWKILLELLE
ncbi:hypothetical protein [Flavilitoribacter nigricans]|uniref:Uncharacterized protein n=1 Tax=Flavilitoribacter nigricans (strain ATCC 23147 / DSM 23189 / NBRC 102662 / NCIMB 1420 / SS-2) TaxID=1122177 RepID=A0A2D0N9G8_FLAN2|nr:hypothetical protein [Flavilitoribacter nigricans]PHN04789.1 hypothetical protein CRP01_19960 [Flavilitoribacter nigricans DSM 23189 = NBRC 102662]